MTTTIAKRLLLSNINQRLHAKEVRLLGRLVMSQRMNPRVIQSSASRAVMFGKFEFSSSSRPLTVDKVTVERTPAAAASNDSGGELNKKIARLFYFE
jgi:hypothetical protein